MKDKPLIKEETIIWEPFPGAQERFLSCPVWECLLHGNRGGGKNVPLSTKVATVTGWRTIGSLKIGDMIYANNAKLYPVTGIFHQGIKTEYQLTLQDGREVISGDEHLWLIKDVRLKDKVINTIDMMKNGLSTGKEGKKQWKYRIPNCESLKWKEKELLIKPYFLGCLIAEGTLTTRTPRIATSNKFILDLFKKEFSEFQFTWDKHTQNNYNITDKSRSNNRLTDIIGSLKLNVKCHDKFIPEIYKHGSIQQRLDLLSGLMDTDGCISCNGNSEFVSASKQLINDFAYVCRSLGIRCRIAKDNREDREIEIRGKTYVSGLVYRAYINTSIVLAKDPKKIKNASKKKFSNSSKYVAIVDIQKLESKSEMVCISIDSPDHTYLIEDFIVTHNTDVLIMDYLQGVGVGYGIDYKGLLLREATTELGDVITKTKKWIPRIFPSAKFNNQKKTWTFESGETLWLNYARVEDDYEQYHGHEYPWIGWEEITNHPFDKVYKKLMSCNRSSNPNIPKKYRATCNPSGPGHQWVKARFIDRMKAEHVYTDEFGQTRTHIQSALSENKAMAIADPMYMAKLKAMTQDNKLLHDAWVLGSWDLITGGFFTDVWNKKIHVLPHFIPPKSWKIIRSFDWGSSKPWAVTYGMETNGEQPASIDIPLPYFPTGSTIILNEIYGWNGTVNEGDNALSSEIAERILVVDKALFAEYGIKVTPGPADSSIYDVKDGTSIGAALTACHCNWTRANKGAGSRVAGWSIIRQMLGAAKRKDLEHAHLYFFEQAAHHIRTLPIMQRDKRKPEDIDTDLEDHLMDSLRYLLARKLTTMKRRKVRT